MLVGDQAGNGPTITKKFGGATCADLFDIIAQVKPD